MSKTEGRSKNLCMTTSFVQPIVPMFGTFQLFSVFTSGTVSSFHSYTAAKGEMRPSLNFSKSCYTTLNLTPYLYPDQLTVIQ